MEKATNVEIIQAMQEKCLRVVYMVAAGRNGEWELLDLHGYEVATIKAATAELMIRAGQLVRSPNPAQRPRGKYENEIYHLSCAYVSIDLMFDVFNAAIEGALPIYYRVSEAVERGKMISVPAGADHSAYIVLHPDDVATMRQAFKDALRRQSQDALEPSRKEDER
jgi:hypothetical protein